MSSDPSSVEFLLGIDGGGTKTVAWLAQAAEHRDQSARIIGRGFGGPSNQRAVGPASAMRGLETAVAAAFANAAIPRQCVAAACLGLAGADRESDRQVVEQWAGEVRLANRVRVVNDALPLLYSGDMQGVGIALIAGTGSLALGRNSHGTMARSGGWGWLFGDEGSAYALGREILKAVSRAADGRGAPTTLTQAVLRHLQISAAADIVSSVYGHQIPRSVIAELAPLVFEQAGHNDPVAGQIVTDSADALAELLASVATRLQMPSPLSIAMTGAVLVRQPDYRDRIRLQLQQRNWSSGNPMVVTDAVEGAVNLAEQIRQEWH